jgi:hypothetical protein
LTIDVTNAALTAPSASQTPAVQILIATSVPGSNDSDA